MKKATLLLLLLLGVQLYSSAQDCTGNRYYLPIFPNVDQQLNVQYGSNLDQNGSNTVDLYMDIYTPQGDSDNERPVILLAHGGSFTSGNKTDLDSACIALAKMGYVAVTIQYRLLTIDSQVFADPGLAFKKEVIRAMHDMRAAIRFLRRSVAESGNPYGINPDLILVGGFSAGAILANQTAYLDTDPKIPAEVVTYTASQGGLEGNSGNSGYNSVPQLVISFCGAIGDTTWIETGDQPFVGVHNVGDNVVPNEYGQPNIGVVIPVDLYGDSLIYKRTLTVDVNSAYMSVPGNGHCDFPPESGVFVTNFVHDQLCNQGLLAITNDSEINLVSVYPNPAQEGFLWMCHLTQRTGTFPSQIWWDKHYLMRS